MDRKVRTAIIQLSVVAIMAAVLVLWVAAQSEGPTVSPSPPSPTAGGSSGSSHKQLEIERIIKAIEAAKVQKVDRYEYLRDLLYKEPFTTEKYHLPSVYLYYQGNETVTRNQPINLSFVVRNDNPIEIRRVLYLTLEMKAPGSSEFSPITAPQLVQVNEYHDTANTTMRGWPEFSSLKDIKLVGEVDLRFEARDGQYTWYYVDTDAGERLRVVDSRGNVADYPIGKSDPPLFEELRLNLTNSPPTLDNATIVTESPEPMFNEPIVYLGRVLDLEGDQVNVTLHVLDDQNATRDNVTQYVDEGDNFEFMAGSYNFFSKDDSGKNFSYYYTLDDGINSTVSKLLDGPHIKKSTTIYVDNPAVSAEEDYYWWDSYNFSISMKNMEPGEARVQVSLDTWTPKHQWKRWASQEVVLGTDPRTVWFNAKPFLVEDADQTFFYRFNYSEMDQKEEKYRKADGPKRINAKLVQYHLASLPTLLTLLALLGLALMAAVFVERRFYR